MKSVGEAMGIGRTFTEAFLKAYGSRELERGRADAVAEPGRQSARRAASLVPRARSSRRAEELESGDLLRAKRAGWGDDSIGARSA